MNPRRLLPVIVDTTLRDGAQMPGVRLQESDRISIVNGLAALGVEEIELGCAPRNQREAVQLRSCVQLHPSIEFSIWCRAREDDIDRAFNAEAGTLHCSFPVSRRHMAILSMSENDVLRRLEACIAYAASAKVRITVGAQDATRAEIPFLHQFMATAVSAGAARIRIADTVGIATPPTIHTLITAIKEKCPQAKLEFHGHNDFGIATAVTLAAADAGADAVSCTIQGVGERAGNAALEEFITTATMLCNYAAPYNLNELSHLCEIVGASFGLPPRQNKALCGTNAFTHESGIHCHGTLKEELAYQPFRADLIGRTTTFRIGELSGISSVVAALNSCGITATKSQAEQLLKKISP